MSPTSTTPIPSPPVSPHPSLYEPTTPAPVNKPDSSSTTKGAPITTTPSSPSSPSFFQHHLPRTPSYTCYLAISAYLSPQIARLSETLQQQEYWPNIVGATAGITSLLFLLCMVFDEVMIGIVKLPGSLLRGIGLWMTGFGESWITTLDGGRSDGFGDMDWSDYSSDEEDDDYDDDLEEDEQVVLRKGKHDIRSIASGGGSGSGVSNWNQIQPQPRSPVNVGMVDTGYAGVSDMLGRDFAAGGGLEQQRSAGGLFAGAPARGNGGSSTNWGYSP